MREFRDFEGSQAPTANPEVLGRESMESGFGPGRESNQELRNTPNSTTTGSPHTDLVSTSNQPSHDTHAGQHRLAPQNFAERPSSTSQDSVPSFIVEPAPAASGVPEQPSIALFEDAFFQVRHLVPWVERSDQTDNLIGNWASWPVCTKACLSNPR